MIGAATVLFVFRRTGAAWSTATAKTENAFELRLMLGQEILARTRCAAMPQTQKLRGDTGDFPAKAGAVVGMADAVT